jgi:NAD(P)-dependent dehydrogenase (short-subunit alcohol dehydrogenase family)
MRMAGQTALVTGGAAGIGLATARALARAGARVVVVDRVAGGELAGARFVAADVTDDDPLRRLFGELDDLAVLVNKAGGVEAPCFPDAPAERWSAVLDLR